MCIYSVVVFIRRLLFLRMRKIFTIFILLFASTIGVSQINRGFNEEEEFTEKICPVNEIMPDSSINKIFYNHFNSNEYREKLDSAFGDVLGYTLKVFVFVKLEHINGIPKQEVTSISTYGSEFKNFEIKNKFKEDLTDFIYSLNNKIKNPQTKDLKCTSFYYEFRIRKT